MKPDWQTPDGRVQLYLGDCLEILPQLPEGSVDAVVTDPPYNVGLQYANDADMQDRRQYAAMIRGLYCQMTRCATRLIVTPGNVNQSLWPPPLWTMAWVKRNGITRTPLTVGQHMNHACWEPILVYGKLVNVPKHDVFMVPITKQSDVGEHPCPKPMKLIQPLLTAASAVGETVLDPFMGSGTTGVACVQTGRRFIGIEIEPRYFDIAVERIKAALDGVPPKERAAGQLPLLEKS